MAAISPAPRWCKAVTLKPAAAKRAFAQAKGLYLKWIDKDPLGTDGPTGKSLISHTNPVYRIRAARFFQEFGWWLVRHQRMRWRVNVTLVFRHPDKDERVELSVDTVATINEISAAVEPEIEKALEEAKDNGYADKYLHTEFLIECDGRP